MSDFDSTMLESLREITQADHESHTLCAVGKSDKGVAFYCHRGLTGTARKAIARMTTVAQRETQQIQNITRACSTNIMIHHNPLAQFIVVKSYASNARKCRLGKWKTATIQVTPIPQLRTTNSTTQRQCKRLSLHETLMIAVRKQWSTGRSLITVGWCMVHGPSWCSSSKAANPIIGGCQRCDKILESSIATHQSLWSASS